MWAGCLPPRATCAVHTGYESVSVVSAMPRDGSHEPATAFGFIQALPLHQPACLRSNFDLTSQVVVPKAGRLPVTLTNSPHDVCARTLNVTICLSVPVSVG